MVGRRIGIPAHFQLEAAVAKVTGDGHHVGHHVIIDLIDVPGLSLAEQDVLDAVEAQQSVAELFTSHGTVLIVSQHLNHVVTGHQVIEGILIQRPRVDVRIDTEVGGGAEQEGLALLPPLAGFEEAHGSLVEVGLGLVFLQSLQAVHQVLGLRCEVAVSGIHRLVEVLLDDGFFGFFVLFFYDVVLATGGDA